MKDAISALFGRFKRLVTRKPRRARRQKPARVGVLAPAERSALNALLGHRYLAAVLSLPTNPLRPDDEPRRKLVVEKLTLGRRPRRPVFIPMEPRLRAKYKKRSKHAKQQPANGCFSKKGEQTIAERKAFLEASSIEANRIAAERRARRVEVQR